ncbi:Hypothetical predicted protein [Prunus dulcis]|uniref:Uncharacterized protein n=1 Tax=Prunus dulcis TaxID=3755 RepID=A0A5E4E646_PRUDU|nr:uncharacterized protein LOC117620182 [Prunus dulcis]VVA11244.1 Hypothetical predicted protein [Prunus dulcis]
MEVVECKDTHEVVCENELEGCGTSEFDNRSKGAEERCVELESEIVKRKSEYEALEAKFRALEVEKLAMEEVIKALNRESDGIKEQDNSGGDEKNKYFGGEKGTERIVDLTEDKWEEDKVFQLMIENKVLECEKKKAENEVEAWKEKFGELELGILKLDNNLVLKGGKVPLAERIRLEDGSPNVNSPEDSRTTQPNKRIKLEDGLHVERDLECSRDKDIVVDLVDVGSTCHSLGKGICDLQSAGSPPDGTLCKHRDGIKEEKKGVCVEYTNSRQARKQLKFEEDGSPCKKMAPSTPGGGVPSSLSVINISDSDDELNITHCHTLLPTDDKGTKGVCISLRSVLGETVGCEKDMTIKNCIKQTDTDRNVEEDTDDSNEAFLLASTPKRKRASNIVTSDSESSDDNIPIRKRKKMHLQEKIHDQVGSASVVDNATGAATPRRRRLVRLRKCGEGGGAERNYSNKDVEDDELLEEVGSDSEGESLGGFIVNSSDDSKGNDASTESEDSSDDNVNFDEILSKFQRNKNHKSKWEFEADMLAAFGKDPYLCMKAVCALYRQQTCEEKISKGSLCNNYRGFSKFDALRGSVLAEFLTGGDPNGDVNKTVKELKEYDPRGIEQCRTLASRYSKQLFEIYNNKEDPLFLPSF